MKSEFYRPKSEMFPTFSLLIATSLAGVGGIARPIASSKISEGFPAITTHYTQNYYYPTATADQDDHNQIESLRNFAENLLEKSQDSPQEVVDLLNSHFWELL